MILPAAVSSLVMFMFPLDAVTSTSSIEPAVVFVTFTPLVPVLTILPLS